MIIFLHKVWILIGNIIMFYFFFAFGFFIIGMGIFLLVFLIDFLLNFIFDFSIVNAYAFMTRDLSTIENALIILPFILFFARPYLLMASEEDIDKDNVCYNPFSDWGDLIYQKKHKLFYDKHYTNAYIKWERAQKKKKKKRRK